jgi:hypothetical protein
MTAEEGMRAQIECYRRMTPQQRLQICFDLYDLSRTVARQGMRYRHPDWDAEQVEREVLRRIRLGSGVPD